MVALSVLNTAGPHPVGHNVSVTLFWLAILGIVVRLTLADSITVQLA
jgi:hypothetical protein